MESEGSYIGQADARPIRKGRIGRPVEFGYKAQVTGNDDGRRARPSTARRAAGHARGFRALVKWRTGCEGRISYLKRGYGWDRTRLDGRDGASIWCGPGVFTRNLAKISALAA